jgi:PAS domain-containing protein
VIDLTEQGSPLLQPVLDAIQDGVVVLDEDGKVHGANAQFARMLGYSMEEVRQLYVWDWDDRFDKAQLKEMIDSVDRSGDQRRGHPGVQADLPCLPRYYRAQAGRKGARKAYPRAAASPQRNQNPEGHPSALFLLQKGQK